MRALIFAGLIILLLPIALALDGYCTGQYLEKGDNWQEGLVQEGDVFEYWCELPAPLSGNEPFTLRLHYNNAELVQGLLAPRAIHGTTIVIYP